MRQWHRYQSIQWLRKFCQGYWMPIVLGIVATVAVLGLWQQLLVQEQLHVQQLVHHEANAIKSELSQELSRRILVLEQMANRWQVSGGTPKPLWEADAANYIKDFYGYQAIEWVDPSFHVRWVVPLNGNEAAQSLDLSQEPRRQLTLSIARDLRQTIVTRSIFLAQGGKGFLACIPLFVKDRAGTLQSDRFDGFIVGVFQYQSLFDSILKTSPWYQVKFYDRNALIYSQGTLSVAVQPETSVVQAYSADWQVQVFPTPELIAAKRSPLPTVVLWGGLVAAWTLAFIVYLGQRAENQTRRARKINQQLQEKIVEHQQIEIELRRSEASNRNLSDRLELAVQSAQIGIWDWDIINDCLIWNDQMYTLYGVKPSDFLGAYQAWASALHPDDFEMTTAAIQQAIRGERDYEPEFRVVHPDGSIRYIQAHAVVQRDSCGQAQRMIGVNFNITERKQAEIALRESETKYRQLIGHMNAGFVVHAPDTHILQCNATACDLLGLSMDQMLGKVALDPAWHFVREDGTIMPVEEYPVNRVLSTQVPLENYVLGINRGTQSKLWVLVTAFPEFDANDQLRQVVVTFIDISELKQAETQRREMTEVMENAVSGISKLDIQGRYVYVNKAYADITGYQPEEMIGMGWQQTVHPSDLELPTSAYQRMVQDGKVELEAKGIRKDGSTLYKQLVMISSYDEQQQFVGHYCFMKDISDRKAAEDALRQSESTLRSFFNSGAMLMGIVELHDNDIVHLSDNQAAASFFGTTSEAMQNRFASEIGVPEPHLQQWISAYREAERTQAPVHFEYDRQTPTGQCWLAASVCQIASEFSQHPRFSYIVQDITERKQAELALEKELLRSQALFNTSIDGVVVMNHQGNVVQTSPSFAQMIGYSVEDTLTLHVADWDAQWSREELQQIIQDSSILPPVFETRHRRKDGSLYDVEISYSRVEIEGEMMHFCICRDISERKRIEADRKRAEELLQFSQAQLEALVANMPGMVYRYYPNTVDSLHHFTFVSSHCCELLELAPEVVIQDANAFVNLIHPEDLPSFLSSLADAVEHFLPWHWEGRIATPSGQLKWIEGNSQAQHTCNGAAWDGLLVDISDRKRAEIALENSQARFAGILEIASDAIISVNAKQQITLFNKGAERIFGYRTEEVLGQPLTMLIPHRLTQAHQQYVNQYAKSESNARQMAQQGAIFGRRKDDTEFPAEASISQLNLNGEITFTTFLRDITARQKAEAAIARLAAIVESSEDAIISKSLDGIITSWNAGAEKLFGYTAEEMLGQSVALLMPEGNLDDGNQILERIRQGEYIEHYDSQLRRKDGTLIDVSISLSPIKDANGKLIGLSKIARDISDRKEAEEKLQKSEAALAEAQRMVHLGNWELDVATKQITWSDEMFCLFGFDPNAPEPAYAEHFNNIHPDDRIRLQQSLDLAMTEGIPYEIELRCFRTDGTIGYMEARGEAKYNNQGQIVKLFGTALDITARKQAEIALQQSEEKFRMAIDFTYNWEYWQAPDGSFVYVSPSCERITGYSPSEFIQDPNLIKNIIHPDDYSIFDHHVCDDVSETGFIEFRIVTRSGAIRWMAHICQPVFNSEGQYLGRRASNQDVTERVRLEAERQQAQQALRKSEARFQAFMNHSPASAWMTDVDGTILYASQTYLGTFQLPTTDLIGKSIFELYPVEVAQQFLEHIQTVAKTQQVLEAIEVAPRPNGTMGDFLVYKFPIPDSSGQTLIGGVAIDVTQQHQAEEELRHQKEMFQAIINHIPVMIALFNDRGQIEFINPELERVLGWSFEEWQQRNLFVDCYPDPTYPQNVLDHILAATGNWKDVTTLNANGQSLETSWANVPLSGGRFLGIGQDISDRKHKEIALRQAMEAAEAANLAKSIFLANMSHELRTPLNVILGFTQVMAHDSSLTPSQKEDLQTIRRSGDHLLSLINDVLDLSKIEAGHCILENTGFDLISLLHTLRTMMSERAKAKQLQLMFDIAPEVPQFVMADQQKLRQVLLNLLSNAFKFTKQGSVTLRVTSQKPRDQISSALSTDQNESYLKNFVPKPFYTLQFEVIDTGVGIAAKDQDTIFDAFVQAEAGRKSMTGTGLGLTISRKLVELMNGKIFVQSIPNIGSTFSVTVPVYPTSGIDIQPEQCDRTVIGLVPGQLHRRILVVDDQPENRLLMVRLLTQLRLEVREATNGQEAIHIWQEWQPDLTWMDIRMPGLDGYEATKQIRAMEQQKASIIIALTAQASQSDRTLALAAGCNDYISKPFQEETVFLKMAEYLGLEYLYAEPSALAGTPTSASDTAQCQPSDLFDPKSLTLPDLSTLPPTWLKDVEEAAICGDDRMIVNLSEQLPPEFTQLGAYITELANQFQFEQILDLLDSKSLP